MLGHAAAKLIEVHAAVCPKRRRLQQLPRIPGSQAAPELVGIRHAGFSCPAEVLGHAAAHLVEVKLHVAHLQCLDIHLRLRTFHETRPHLFCHAAPDLVDIRFTYFLSEHPCHATTHFVEVEPRFAEFRLQELQMLLQCHRQLDGCFCGHAATSLIWIKLACLLNMEFPGHTSTSLIEIKLLTTHVHGCALPGLWCLHEVAGESGCHATTHLVSVKLAGRLITTKLPGQAPTCLVWVKPLPTHAHRR
mmetsp:Transcript_111723/g.271398  ORF Transcript_111723/g.271398 Transcript_111723/m.271398 type:complete len:247 (-) Transcript_111723:699-1439(-)